MRWTVFAAVSIFAATPGLALQYHAAPVAKSSEKKVVVRDTIWNCGESGCAAAGKSVSRPGTVCGALARKIGKLQSFSVAGGALTAAELEKCNSAAR